MAALKTQKNNASVKAFLDAIGDENKRKDAKAVLALMKKATGAKPFMWGDSIIGFGEYHYQSERSRQEGDWFITGFSPRKTSLTLYIMPGIAHYQALVKQLGKCKTSGSCLYINRLSDVDSGKLEELIATAFREFSARFNKKS